MSACGCVGGYLSRRDSTVTYLKTITFLGGHPLIYKPSKRYAVGFTVFFSISVGPAFAVDVLPSGQLQVQADYSSEESNAGAHWRLTTPNSHVGLTAVEQSELGTFVGVWQVGVNPITDDETQATLVPQDAYLNWRRDIFSIYGGRLPSLEQVMLIDLTENQHSRESNGLAIGTYVSQTENEALRVDIASGESFVVSAQWLLDESDELSWRTGAVLRTPEGTASLTIRRDPGQDIVWGNQLTVLMGDWSIAGALLYDNDEILAWDLVAQANLQTLIGFLSYNVLADQQGQWAVGLKQPFSEALLGFSEITWHREDDSWSWSTGVRMTF